MFCVVAKRQEFLVSLPGIVKQDPALPDDKPLPPPPPRPKNAIFEDEEKSKVKIELVVVKIDKC